MQSIIQDTRECYFCRNPKCEEHHIFNGVANRPLSTKYGVTIWLCRKCHKKLHLHGEAMKALKRFAQQFVMDYYGWTKEEFIQIFGENHI